MILNERMDLKFRPLTLDKWNDLEQLFGENGACGGCWCMYWRLTRKKFTEQLGNINRRAFKKIVKSSEIPGIIAYSKGKPIGWISIAPREQFPALERSQTLKRIDDKPVWSIVCFFIDKSFRKKGITRLLIKNALDYAKENGANIVEGYPAEPIKKMSDASVYTGTKSAFIKEGFGEVTRGPNKRTIMRYFIK
jgi:GNAT superfamily N-acetyltransferase